MSPTSEYEFWGLNQNQGQKMTIQCLMPNGILIPLDLCGESLLSEVKEELWCEAKRFPLFAVLKEPSSYNFKCINSMAEKEDLMDETRRLADVRPFCSLLKVVEREGDRHEQTLNTKIGQLIGKALHDFDALKSLEVNEFRWRMKLMVQGVVMQFNTSEDLLDRIQHHFPCDVADSDDLPDLLVPKLRDGNMIVGVRIDNVETCFSFSVLHTTTPFQLLTIALQKNATLLGQYPIEADIASGYVLKVGGRQEYLIGPHPLSRFLFVREALSRDVLPSFVAVPMSSVVLDDPESRSSVSSTYSSGASERTSRTSFATTCTLSSTLRKKLSSVSSWDIQDQFSFRVGAVSLLNCSEATDVGIQAGIFHGGRSLCEPIKTSAKRCAEGGECTWNEDLTFALKVRDLPRTARLCLVVYAISKIPKGGAGKSSRRTFRDADGELFINPVAWANTTIFDYERQLKTGSMTVYMWTFAEDVQNEEILNPLGTVVSNPNVDHATALTLTFAAYTEGKRKVVVYPHMDSICELAAKFKQDSGPEDNHIYSSLVSINSTDSGVSSMNGSTTNLTTLLNRGGEPAMYYVQEQLRFMAERDPLHEMHEQERKFLWSLREPIAQHEPTLLPKLLQCIEWNDHKETAEMLSLLPQWPKLPPARALELLDFAYADAAVRSYAVDCIRQVNDDELLLYLLQLVQALKHESYLQCELVDFLIERALRNRRIGHFLFWHLRSEMHVPAVSVRFGLMLEAYCRGAPDHMKILLRQQEALGKLKETSETARQSKEGRDKLKLLVQETLRKNPCSEALSNVLCPLDPALHCRRLIVERCKTMDSKMKPLWAVFENGDQSGGDIYFIFKHGDDLRQDMLTLQMIRIMDRLWKKAGLDFRMNPYHCISTGNRVGLIEVVLNAETIANIQKEKSKRLLAPSAFEKGTLFAWLKEHNPSDSALNAAVEEFSLSCAGYSVATYILGIADRHSDNIMVKRNGQLFHIDFGHILGHFKEKFGIRRERVPFVLTKDFEHVITKGDSKKGAARFEVFQKNCEQAFLILRRHGSFIISLFAMMISTGLPELSCEKDLNYLRETLVLDLSENDALRHFRSRFEEAKENSWKTSVNWTFHNWSKDNQ